METPDCFLKLDFSFSAFYYAYDTADNRQKPDQLGAGAIIITAVNEKKYSERYKERKKDYLGFTHINFLFLKFLTKPLRTYFVLNNLGIFLIQFQ